MKRILICLTVAAAFLFNLLQIKAEALSITAISARAAILIDAQTGQVIFSKNETARLPMASTTKIMTALLALESGNLDEEFVVDSDAIKVEGSSMGLTEGDIVTKRALCYGMLLPSGNDAANSTAIKLAGSYEAFADMMNERARQIGMKNTHFVTPSGLHDNNHYSTAYDMALLAREALKNDDFKEICSSKSAKLSFGNPPYDRWLTNSNKLLSRYPGCIGIKTGFTDEAGRCLVSAVQRDGITLICVTLHAPDDWNDHIKMYDYGFSVVSKRELCFKDDIYEDVVGGTADSVKLKFADIPACTVVNGKMINYTYEIIKPAFVYAPIKEDAAIGTVKFYYKGELIESMALVSAENNEAVIKEQKKSVYRKIIDYLKQYM
jgi:D-alanyl-D-alanine carboxypeptidase/D-alanyl-D-alanine carboxypeptidase (penicillin-binding protein 5/6)